MEQGFLVAEIIDRLSSLDKRDHRFAAQMIKFYDEFKRLSARQEARLREILAKYTDWDDADNCYQSESRSCYR